MPGPDPSTSFLSALMAEAKWERPRAPAVTLPSGSEQSQSLPPIPREISDLFPKMSDFIDVPDPGRMSNAFKEIVYHWGWTMLQASAFEHSVRITAHKSLFPTKDGGGTKAADAYTTHKKERVSLGNLIPCLRLDRTKTLFLDEIVRLRNRVAHSELDFDQWSGVAESERYTEFVHSSSVPGPWFEGGVQELEAFAIRFRDAMRIVVTESKPIF